MFYISMYVKEKFMLMTGSAIDEDGSHHQQPYWDYFKANSFTLGALWTFSPIYVERRGRPQLNHDRLFCKLPSPLIMGSSGVVPQNIIFIA